MYVISQDKKRIMQYDGAQCIEDKASYPAQTYLMIFSDGGPQIMGAYESMSRAKNILMEIAHQAESGRDFYYMPD